MSENLPVQNPETNRQKKKSDEASRKNKILLIAAVVLVVQIILAVIIGKALFRSGYDNSKKSTSAKIRQDAYNTVYDITENANHTSNKVSIALDDIRERSDLEVLEVETNYLYVSDEEDRAKAQLIWYMIPGTGTYTVDLKTTEFLVDNERQHVLVKAPLPVITKFTEEKARELEYRDDRFIFKGSVGEGEKTARKMLYKAHVEMMKNLEDNTGYLEAAKDSAVRLITSMIKAVNPSLTRLSVTVEFLSPNPV